MSHTLVDTNVNLAATGTNQGLAWGRKIATRVRGLLSFVETRILEPIEASFALQRSLAEVDMLSERDLQDIGYTRDALRASVVQEFTNRA